jgi:hypothetical protein
VGRSADAEAAAETQRDELSGRRSALEARRDVLTSSEAFASHTRLVEQRQSVSAAVDHLTGDRERLARDRRTIDGLILDADQLRARIEQQHRASQRHSDELLGAAQLACVDVVSGAAVATRLDDIEQVRNELGRVTNSERDRRTADELLGKARSKADDKVQRTDAANRRLEEARAELTAELDDWLRRWPEIVTDELREALAASEEPGPAYAQLVMGTRDSLIAAREQRCRGLAELDESIAALSAERDAIAAERDEAPPASDLRPASQRPGAPLWQLVRFAGHGIYADMTDPAGRHLRAPVIHRCP